MSFADLILIAISLSMDAFAVATCKGLSQSRLELRHYIITGMYFGGFQALMPFIGFIAGYNFSEIISGFDYIISFILLAFIGGNMIKEAFEEEEECCKCGFGPGQMIPLAVATSIDALAVGVTFAGKASFDGNMTSNIFFDILTIGTATFIISALGIKIGNLFGTKYKKKAEITGGIVLIGLGIKFFVSHFI